MEGDDDEEGPPPGETVEAPRFGMSAALIVELLDSFHTSIWGSSAASAINTAPPPLPHSYLRPVEGVSDEGGGEGEGQGRGRGQGGGDGPSLEVDAPADISPLPSTASNEGAVAGGVGGDCLLPSVDENGGCNTTILPLMLLRGVIIFPGDTLPIRIETHDTVALDIYNHAIRHEKLIAVMLNRGKASLPPHIHIGTIVKIKETRDLGGGSLAFLAEGTVRFKLVRRFSAPASINKFPMWEVEPVVDRSAFLPREFRSRHRSSLTPFSPSVFALYDCLTLGEKAISMFRSANELGAGEDTGLWKSAPSINDPELLSYWLSKNIAGSDVQKQDLLNTPSTCERLKKIIYYFKNHQVIACNYCRTPLGRQSDIIYLPGSAGTCGSYVNPHGHVHQTITLSRATSTFQGGDLPCARDSWFPGYAWTIIYCRGCHSHIGWLFTRANILDFSIKPPSFVGIARASITLLEEVEGEEVEGDTEGEEGSDATESVANDA